MKSFTRSAIITLAATGLALAGATAAAADTNKNTQVASFGTLSNLLSPAAQEPHVQTSAQEMTKTNTSNNSVVDYNGTAIFRSSVP